MDPWLERPALDALYGSERWWASAGRWLSNAGALVLIIAGSDYRVPGITLLLMSIGCQLVSWHAMRAAQRLELQRLVRLRARQS